MKVGDLVRPWKAQRAIGLVVEVINKKEVKVQWIGKKNQLMYAYQKHKLEVINESR
jgi:hypothetical protein